jgi:HPt (histidine-containing phosphotransfer) domain-containing protein
MLGQKYDGFLQTYLSDTASRLEEMQNALVSEMGFKKCVLHAHSISSSSATVGVMQLAEIASAMELKAAENGVQLAVVASMLDAMQSSFAATRQALLEEGQRLS